MTTLLLSHPASLEHLTRRGTRRPDRIRAVAQCSANSRFDRLVRDQARGLARSGHALSQRAICRGTAAHRALERPGLSRRRHLDVSRHLGSGDARRRRRVAPPMRSCQAPMIMRSSRSARRAITPKTASRWLCFSITPPSPPATPSANSASVAQPWSISTCITAMAPRIYSGPIRP